jgi:glycosyltransferase involved in cell wall biosynthesis
MPLISIVTPCYNEEGNIADIYEAVKKIFSTLPQYEYEHVFIDNSSEDNTQHLLKKIAHNYKNIKVIINSRNFGWLRSPIYGLYQAQGDAIISLVADFQDPPELIYEFIKRWEEGNKIIIGIKTGSEENRFMFSLRKFFYSFIKKISDTNLIKNFTGFGLYDKSIINILKNFGDANPYFRGMLAEVGFNIIEIPYKQPQRKHGYSKGNLYRLFDVALLGITHYSKFPLRLMTITGFCFSIISVFLSFLYICLKLLFWSYFPLGMAPLLTCFFLFFSLQMFFLGLLGEYISAIQTQLVNRPLVIEKERINF